MDGIFKNTRAKSRELNKQVFEKLLRNQNPKSIAGEIGMTRNQVYQHIAYLGFSTMYVTKAEREAIMKMRAFSDTTYEQHTGLAG